jgi:hypothetical protein|tara:strand:- start:5022 stop:5249 length:228 start_codon:yes stop_codon:yes gene_type:complete
MKQQLGTIKRHWIQPLNWTVDVDQDTIRVCDSNNDLVVSSALHSCVEKSIQEHLQEAQAVANLDLLLSMCEEEEA